MAYAIVQSKGAQANNVGSLALAFDANVTAGNAIIVMASDWAMLLDTTSVTDSQSATYTRDVAENTTNPRSGIYSTANHPGGATTVTLNPGGTTEDISIVIAEVSGLASSGIFDVGSVGTGTSATHSPGTTGTTTQANELVVITGTHGGADPAAPTATGFTILVPQPAGSDMPLYLGHKRITSTGTQTASITWENVGYSACIATYKEAAAAAGAVFTLPNSTLLGGDALLAAAVATYTLSGGGTVPVPVGTGTGLTNTNPAYTLSGGGAVPVPSGSGTGITSTVPVYTLSGSATIPVPTGSGTGLTSTVPSYTLSGSGTVPEPSGSGTGLTSTVPGYTLSGSGTVPEPSGSGTGLTSTVPNYTLSGAGSVPSPTGSGSGLTYTSASVFSGSATIPAPTGSGTGLTNASPGFTLSGTRTLAAPSGSGAGLTFTAPVTTTYGVLIDWNDDADYADTGEVVTTRVRIERGITMERGRDQIRALAPPMAGTLDFALDNTSRDYSTENAASPLVGLLRPGHRVRVTGDNGTLRYLSTALLDDLPQEPAIGVRAVRIPCLGTLTRLAGKTVTTAAYQNITTDVALGHILDAAGWPAGERNIQAGITTLLWWWLDEVDAFEAIRTLLNTEGPGAALYEDGQGRLVFENRHYRILTARSNTSQGTFRDSGASPWHREPFDLNPGLKGVINRAEIAVNIRTAQALAQVWALGGNLILGSGAEARLVVRATTGDPFTAAVAPVLTTDYTLIAGSATLTLDRTSGRAVTLTVTAGAAGATITGLRMRAQLLIATAVTVRNTIDTTTSVARYGLRTWAEPLWPEIDLAVAQDFANAIVGAYAEPRATATITIEGADATMLGHCLAREISDRVTVVEAQTGLNGDLLIERIRHEITVGNRHVTTLGLEKVSAGLTPLIWDFGTWGNAVFGW